MQLNINSPTQEKPFAHQIDFLPEHIVLHAATDIVLAYKETSLNLCLHLGLTTWRDTYRTSHGRFDRQERLTTYPCVRYVTFEFITDSFTYQIAHHCALQDLFKFIDYKFPLKISYSFENADKDALTQKLAQNISVALKDHLEYGIHEPIGYPHMVQNGAPIGVPIYIGIRDKEEETSPSEKIIVSSIISLLFVISFGFIICVMGYLIPQWDFHDIVHWFFASFCLLILGLYIWFAFAIYKKHKLHKKLSELKRLK